mgnify:CR=1 FL=1
MERTISAMIGKGSVNHNTRAFMAKNVDKSRSVDNVEFCQEEAVSTGQCRGEI